jgi:glycosyltransferase involved in cell wall biosynthesis
MMPSKPLISIVTITYNAKSEIVPTVASVSRQTFSNFEHLIIDGASTDSTLQLARANGVPDLKILSEPDKGLYDAMNKGLKMAKGEYILFLNAGDAFHEDTTLEDYAEAAHDGADIIYGDTIIVDSMRTVIGPRHLYAPKELTFDSFSEGMLICHQAFMVRKEIAPLYDLRYRFSADYDWTIKCIKRSNPSRCVNLNKVTIEYLSDGLTDKNHGASLRERFEVMRCHYGFVKAVARHLSFIPRLLKRKISK